MENQKLRPDLARNQGFAKGEDLNQKNKSEVVFWNFLNWETR